MTITTEEAELHRHQIEEVRLLSLAAERDALQARVTELDKENAIMAGLIDVIGNAFNDAGHKIFMEIGKARAVLGEKE
jgi:hypothetical protein